MSEQVRRMWNVLLAERLERWKLIKQHEYETGCQHTKTCNEHAIILYDKHDEMYLRNNCKCKVKKNKICMLKTPSKFDQYQTLKNTRNHTCTDKCNEDCWDKNYMWFQADFLDISANAKLDSSMKSWYALIKTDPKARPPKFAGKNHFKALCYRRSMGFGRKSITLPVTKDYPRSVDMTIRTEQVLHGDDSKYHITNKTCNYLEISYRDNKWFASMIFKVEEVPEYVDNGKYLAIDLGQNFIVTSVNSDGRFTQIRNVKAGRFWNSKLKEVMSKRDHCLTYYKNPSGKVVRSNSHPQGYFVHKRSRKWLWYDDKYKRMLKKKHKQVWHFRHKISHMLVKNTKANTIILGKLNIKNMTKKSAKGKPNNKKGLNRALLDTGLASFVSFLTYKAELLGKKVEKISERNTSKMCCVCGNKKDMSLDKRVYECAKCGSVMDRDGNSAVNIYNRFADINGKPLLHQWSISDLQSPSNGVANSALNSLGGANRFDAGRHAGKLVKDVMH